MSTARKLQYSYAQYLRALVDSQMKLEFWHGEILAMAGGTPEHGILAVRVLTLLSAKLPRGCRATNSDVKVRIVEPDLGLFPDGAVVCGKLERARDDKDSITNPGLIVEVTSPSTEAYDRGTKLEQYKLIKSLQSVWLVSHATKRVTVVERHGRGWRTSDRGAGEQLTLSAPALTLDVDEIYEALDGL
ncbi:MAG: Uma2 family endonuclease [Myxococcaceae bacterium]|nr:Uma2 family endonuclease [Myxococcaceae bacterium]